MPVESFETVNADRLKAFCVAVFEKMGVTPGDARVTADNLVMADLRGIASHGVARLPRYYYGLKDGVMIPRPEIRTIRETPVSAVIDAGAGLGQPVSKEAMEKAIAKARKTGIGLVAVRNSNHYGIAGYYSMMTLEWDMIGLSLTNSAPMVLPTFSRKALFGTNPISVAVPAGRERPFVLDMATSVVPRGKLEVYERKEMDMPPGWASDENGESALNPGLVLQNILHRLGGGLFPLGGPGEDYSGHKGYGLAFLVEIFSALLAGAAFADLTYPGNVSGKPKPSKIGHFFAAMKIEIFRDMDEFKEDMDTLIVKLKECPKVRGHDRVYIHGEKEYEQAAKHMMEGIPLHTKVVESLKEIAAELGMEYTL